MSFDYAELAATAQELLAEFGRAVTLSRPSTSAPTYNTSTGVSTPVSPATYAGTGATFDYAARDIDGTLIQAGDQRLLLSPASPMVEPKTSDLIVIGSTTYTVQRAGKVSPAGTSIVFELQLRGV